MNAMRTMTAVAGLGPTRARAPCRCRAGAVAALLLATLLSAPSAGAQDVERINEIIEKLPSPQEVLETAQRREREQADATAAAANDEKTDESTPRLFLRNGNVLHGRLIEATLPIETPYGRLNVPVEQIVEVRFALRLSEERRAEIAGAVTRLGDDDYKVRNEASKTLADFALDAVPALREAIKSSDEEVRTRAERLLAEIEPLTLEGDDDGTTPLVGERDRILTTRLNIDGVVSAETFSLETPYGVLEVPQRDLVRLAYQTVGPSSASVSVPPSATAPDAWLRTRIEIRRGQRVRLTAGGQLGVPDWGEFCGPAGLGRTSRAIPGTRMLQLVGRIGAKGQPIPLGPQYDERAATGGTLYLGVVPFQYGAAVIGSYEVKVEVR